MGRVSSRHAMTKQAAGPSERRVQRPMYAEQVREVLRLQGSSWAEASDVGARLGISLPDFESWLAVGERLTLDQARDSESRAANCDHHR